MSDATDLKKIQEEFDQLCNVVFPSDVLDGVYGAETTHKKLVLAGYPRVVEQFELIYHCLVLFIRSINHIEKGNWPGHRPVQFLLLTHNLRSLFSAFQCLRRGSYVDALSLLRTCFEALVKVVYISCNSDFAVQIAIDGAIPSMKPGKGAARFNLTSFVRDHLKLDWNTYRLLSYATHSNQLIVGPAILDLSRYGQVEPIMEIYDFDESMFSVVVNNLFFVSLFFMKVSKQLFLTEGFCGTHFSEEDLRRMEKCIELEELSTLFHPKDSYWIQRVDDLGDIVALVEIVESENVFWKDAWGAIRVR